jgi:putative transposase
VSSVAIVSVVWFTSTSWRRNQFSARFRVTQQARQIMWTVAERAEPLRVLICDHDRKFTSSFDAVFQSTGIRVIRTPIQAPQANRVAQRFVRTVRAECLDWLLILNARHLEHALRVFVDHYNRHRAHRSLNLRPPDGKPLPNAAPVQWSRASVSRRDLLGGLLHEYQRAA